jgi:choloylglycine hydrolase
LKNGRGGMNTNHQTFNSFSEFYPYYLSEHSNIKTKKIHCWATVAGNCLGLAFLSYGNFWAVLACVLGTYLVNWFSHWKFQGNQPATFKYPLWSFLSDYKMTYEYFSKKTMLVIFIALLQSSQSFGCTAFCLKDSSNVMVGKNFDWSIDSGAILINSRGFEKSSFLVKPTDIATTWTSLYGSITVNQYGREFPLGGMNEKGLVIEALWLDSTEFPAADARPSLNELQWIQYQLDNYKNTPEVIANVDKIRISNLHGFTHYFVCDAKARCAAVEFLKGKSVVTPFKEIPVLTNDTYNDSLNFIKTLEYFGGKNKIDEKSEASLDRFARTAHGVYRWKPYIKTDAFDAMGLLGLSTQKNPKSTSSLTQFSFVYEPKKRIFNFKTRTHQYVRTIRFNKFNLDCRKDLSIAAFDIQRKIEGDITYGYKEFTKAWNQDIVSLAFKGLEKKFPPSAIKAFTEYPETLSCKN